MLTVVWLAAGEGEGWLPPAPRSCAVSCLCAPEGPSPLLATDDSSLGGGGGWSCALTSPFPVETLSILYVLDCSPDVGTLFLVPLAGPRL